MVSETPSTRLYPAIESNEVNIGLSGATRDLRITDLTIANKLGRGIWQIIWLVFYRPSPVLFHAWRRFLLRLFGASIGRGAHPYPSCKIWAPWNLRMEEYSCLGHGVNCYNVGKITLRQGALVSQHSHLCGATHDYRSDNFDLYAGDIEVGYDAWICADVFVGPGVKIADRSVVTARSVLLSDTKTEEIHSGNPARKVRMRYRNERP